MREFKYFLAKVLAPIRIGTRTKATQVILESKEDLESTRENVPDDDLQRLYVAVMNELLDDAQKHNAMSVFTDVVTWKLAAVAHHCGLRATGDIVRKLGSHLGTLAELADAQREADAAQEAGCRLN